MNFNYLLYPRYKKFYREYKNKQFVLLDVGCGNHCSTLTKKVFNNVVYHGIDLTIDYNNTAEDIKNIDRFFQIDLDKGSLDEVPDNYYDVILMSHVIEHLNNGIEVLSGLARKIKSGGVIYIEFPGVKSLAFPTMRGTLNFCDDTTHVRVYDIRELANTLLQHNCTIVRAGKRRDGIRMLLFPILLLRSLMSGAPATSLWDVLGFADFVYARKKPTH